MRIAIVGQREFGKAAFEAFRARGEEVAGVFCRPQPADQPDDPLCELATLQGVKVFKFASLRAEEARAALKDLKVDLAVLAFVLQFVPQDFVAIPKHGTIQYHPSLLPRHRGPSAINWAIIRGEQRTGLSIFRPTDGLDEGPVILQKETEIAPDDTLGKVYFERLFPMGVAALLEAADLVVSGRARETPQDESQANYEGWCNAPEAKIHWHAHIDQTYNLIRGCNPAPGAWTLHQGNKLQIFDVLKHPARRFEEVRGAIGAVSAIGAQSFHVSVPGGELEVLKVRSGAKKIAAAEFCREAGISAGAVLGE
ncbi:MAG TPA: methionyl-tRNA formyltransferase [Steroidobacteraceae bacterium]|jgi:methionyl-tRNA formyltransferase